ncbi:MAG: glycerol kinase GlpK, partial [Rectinemataceae bacterium]|nr:glycerol kinase GlpK [Rectinemataceae bacterium]
ADSSFSVADLAAIGITNQRETTILWDSRTGEPVYNAIVWQCRRSAPLCDALKAAGYEDRIKAKTGLRLDAYFSATKIRWILDNVEGVREKIAQGRILMGTIDTWLIWKLSRGEYHVTDYSNASRTLLFNIHKKEWDDELLSIFSIPREILPDACPSSGIMAWTAEDAFFGARVPIAGVAGDQHAATFGQACFEPGMAKNTYGTALALFMNTGETPIVSKAGLTTNLGWHVGGKTEYALEGVIFIGGAAVQWLRDGLRIIDDSAQCDRLAASVEDTGGVYMVPAFTGLCAPYWDMYARGLIIGITQGCSREHIARAALESIAYQTRDVMDAMALDFGSKAPSLKVDGGATRSEFLMQFQADILGIPVERPSVTEMAALGAAYLAGLGTGFWKDKGELSTHWKLDRAFEPRMCADQRESLYERWQMAVARSFDWANR